MGRAKGARDWTRGKLARGGTSQRDSTLVTVPFQRGGVYEKYTIER